MNYIKTRNGLNLSKNGRAISVVSHDVCHHIAAPSPNSYVSSLPSTCTVQFRAPGITQHALLPQPWTRQLLYLSIIPVRLERRRLPTTHHQLRQQKCEVTYSVQALQSHTNDKREKVADSGSWHGCTREREGERGTTASTDSTKEL